MTGRITIKVQSRDEGRVIITKIGHLISGPSNTGTDIAFVLNPGVDMMELAKLLDVPKSATACPGTTYADPLACNLATQIAWLEGFSIASECTGQLHCEVIYVGVKSGRVRYDPISRAAIWSKLLQKYRVDVSWDVQGVDCEFKIHGTNKGGSYSILAHTQLSDFGYCIGSAIVQCILTAERSRK